MDLVDKGLVTDQVVLTIGYDIENLTDPKRRKAYRGEVTIDRYGASVPKHAHGTANLGRHTSSTRLVTEKVLALYDRIVDPALLVRRIDLSVNHLIPRRMPGKIKPTSSWISLPITGRRKPKIGRKKRIWNVRKISSMP